MLTLEELEQLKNIDTLTKGQYKALVLDITYAATQGQAGMKPALDKLQNDAEQAVKNGYNVLILSDRAVSATRHRNSSFVSLFCHP